MKTSTKLLAILLSLSMIVLCAVGLTACGDKECDHQWGEWATKEEATCTEKGVQKRECTECGETETSKIDKLDHVDGDDKDHLCDYGCGATADDGCHDAGKDGKCDECGAAIKHTCIDKDNNLACDICSAKLVQHVDANKDHACDCGCDKRFGEHSDSATDNDHVCDYGCKAVFENCFDTEADNDHNCDICGSANTSAHTYTLSASTDATCDAAATNTYVCYCGNTYTENIGDALGHNTTGVTPVEKFVSGCEFALVYDCQRDGCGQEVVGESIYRHNHIARITTSATCSNDGVKTLTCACGDTYTETIEKNTTGHNWVNGTAVNNVRIDTCSICAETKTVTIFTGTTTDRINVNDLADKEIEINNANISLDRGVIDAIGNQNVTVSAGKVEGDDRTDLGLSEDQLAQVGDNPIYNFTISNGSANISNFGEDNWVTITLPYALSEGEDVDSIAIWFINNEGELEAIEATYNNGFVTFKTNHFSYYTVTRLTPAERCALYGHGYVSQHVDGSCTKDAYDLYVCVRCHDRYVDESTLVIADGHDYESSRQEATCTTDGYVAYTCKDCGHSYRTKLNAGGHVYSIEASVEATCKLEGYIKYSCDFCDVAYTITCAKTAHNFVNGVCKDCGETNGTCDHTVLHTVTVDMGEKGACNWVLKYSTCNCGEIKSFDPVEENFFGCDFETISEEEYTDENGNPCEKMTGRCRICGLEIEAWGSQTTASCTSTIQYWYTFKFNNVTIVADLCLEYIHTYHENTTDVTLDLSEYGACGGTADVSKCTACGKIVYYDDWYPSCIDMDSDFVEEEVTDENGFVHYVEKASCSVCGLEMLEEEWEETLTVCETKEHWRVLVRCGETIIYEEEEIDYDSDHENTYEYTLKGTSCEDGVIVSYSCSICGESGQYTTYAHETHSNTYDLAEKGACWGEFYYGTCACGQESYLNVYSLCGEWTYNSYYDEADRLVEVDTCTCDDCGLRYTKSYYSVTNVATCTKTYYYTVVISIGNTLVESLEYTSTDSSHDYAYTATLLGGEGTTCEDGVHIAYRCTVCGDSDNYETYWHHTFEKERIDLSNHGSVCGGYAVITGCACGYNTDVSLDHSLCELGEEWCNTWIDGTLTGSHYTDSEYSYYFDNYAYLYTCAVTSPADAACGYKIRYANYWLKDTSKCVAYRYQTWQFGYNEETGECLYEITIKVDTRTYHNYLDTGENGNTRLNCPDCGSYYYIDNYYNEQTQQTTTDKYCNQIYSDGTQYWWESHKVVSTYTGSFGDNGSKTEYSWFDSKGDTRTEEYASVSYKGYSYNIYEYYGQGDYWERYDYSYSFDPTTGCVRTTRYTNSRGSSSEYSSVICEPWNAIITDVKAPTCTQDGERWEECPVCGKHSEPYTVEANDHNWVTVNGNKYYCFDCGLENANGVSGDIILEDLTEEYGNGQYYVVGYYARNNVDFSQYISLILEDGTEIAIWSGIDITTVDGLRAFKFSKTAVDAWAARNGYSNYQVRFSFVPVGSDGSFDYGITFSERQYDSTITGDVSFTDYIGAGVTETYTIAPTEDGYWTFTSFADGDTVAELYDANGNYLAYNDDGGDGNNFMITYWLNAGETYTIQIRWYNSSRAGNVPLLFETN